MSQMTDQQQEMPPQVDNTSAHNESRSQNTTRFNLIRQTIPLGGSNKHKRLRKSITEDHQSQQSSNNNQQFRNFGRHRHSLNEPLPSSDNQDQEVHGRKSSNSPAWCSTSDSAFSHSQSTLGSDSGNSSNSFFRQSIKDSSGYSENSSSSISDKSMLSSKEGDDDDDLKRNFNGSKEDDLSNHGDKSTILVQKADFFNIVWTNLSYKVPEKKLSKFKKFLQKQNQFFFGSQQIPAQQEQLKIPDTEDDYPPAPLSITNDKSPPLKPPTLRRPRTVIFENLNGCVKSGQLTAILGPSGAGKTTFLKCLTNSIVDGVSGRIDILSSSSERQMNKNQPKTITSQKHLKLCIIPQKDYLFDNLTVMENLVFASRIKNTQANFEHFENVNRVAKLLGLQSCIKLKTGKLSGGQYKRVSIAQELLSKPDILILDEPTSGLDSLNCYKTVSVLRNLVDKSRLGLIPPLAIVMTIHQPQIKIFNLFHHVYIMSSLGQCVYEGKPENLLDTVANCCKLSSPLDDPNPASFIIDLASEVYGDKPIEKLVQFQRVNALNNLNDLIRSDCQTIEAHPTNKISHIMQNIKDSSLPLQATCKQKSPSSSSLEEGSSKVSNDNPNCKKLEISDRLKRRNIHDKNFWLHTCLLIKRLWKSTWRDPLLTKTRLIFHITIPFVFYLIYSQKSGAANACPQVEREFDFKSMASDEYSERLSVQHNELILTFENVSLFFLLLYSFSMCVLAVTALSFPLNMQILLKETTNGWYTMPRFVMAKTLADLPMELTMPIISVSIAYYLTGQPSSYFCWRMLGVTAVMTICSLISQTQGLLFGAYFMNNVQAAVFISQASSLPWIMLSGFTTRVSELPTLLRWLSFGSIYRLGIESIVSIRYGYNMCPCDSKTVDNNPARVVGIPDQLKSLMRYYMDMNTADTGINEGSLVTDSVVNSTSLTTMPPPNNSDVFERIASTLSRASTYGVEISDCTDVRPYILTAREVDEGTLPIFLLILCCMLVALKILLFIIISQ